MFVLSKYFSSLFHSIYKGIKHICIVDILLLIFLLFILLCVDVIYFVIIKINSIQTMG